MIKHLPHAFNYGTASSPIPPTTSRLSSWAFLAGKTKFDQKYSYGPFYCKNVPEEPLQTHHDKPSSIISDSSVTTMGIFP